LGQSCIQKIRKNMLRSYCLLRTLFKLIGLCLCCLNQMRLNENPTIEVRRFVEVFPSKSQQAILLHKNIKVLAHFFIKNTVSIVSKHQIASE